MAQSNTGNNINDPKEFGGLVVVCGTQNPSVQMVDILEATNPKPVGYGLAISDTNDAGASQNLKDKRVKIIIDQALNQLNSLPRVKALLEAEISSIRTQSVEVTGSQLKFTHDYGQIHLAPLADGCHFQQLGVYERDHQLYFDKNLRSAMSSTHQAAFDLHEAVFKVFREKWKDKWSEDAGKSVGQLLAQVRPDIGLGALEVGSKAESYVLREIAPYKG